MFKKWYTKFKEKEERRKKDLESELKERLALVKINSANSRKMHKLAVKYTLASSYNNVLNNYKSLGINVPYMNVFVVNQENLKEIDSIKNNEYGLSNNQDNYINGMYITGRDELFLDKDFVDDNNQIRIEHTIAHEYGHNLWDRFFSNIELNKKYGLIVMQRLKIPTCNRKKLPLKEITNSNPRKKITPIEQREIEFDRYIEEMFADSVALYVNRIIDGETRFFSYSRAHQGEILGKDKEFMESLEAGLYKVFYDGMFTKGLRRTVAELPFIYTFAKKAFKRRYIQKLPEHTIAL